MEFVLECRLGFDLELLLPNSVLEISPDSVRDLLIGVVLNVEECGLCLTCTAVEHSVILSKRFLAITLELVFVLFFSRVVAESEECGMLHDPGWTESQRKVLLIRLFDSKGVWLEREVVAFLIKLGDNLPLLTGVVDNRYLLIAVESGRYSEL